ncbi:MAG: hypothetical protein KAY37_00950 [Phycisphaerae bacterium]|nr:hypothetical protein [Phycisphaerae bacterium]
MSEPSNQRKRRRGRRIVCPLCGGDAFVTSAPRTHPGFVARRRQYCKCGSCGHTFKREVNQA